MDRMFVLLRQDLKTPDGRKKRGYYIAQACHAVAQFYRDYSGYGWDGYMIVLQVANGKELSKWERKLHKDEARLSSFHEPDLHNQKTALCCLTGADYFSELKLFK